MKIIAHRGFRFAFPENTLKAFYGAKKLKAQAVELDIRLCKDNKIVVFHDEEVSRLTSGQGGVKDLTLQQLKKLLVKNRDKIPTLEEVLKIFRDSFQFTIELKCGTSDYRKLADNLINLLEKYKMKEPPILCSFYWPALKYLRKKAKNILIGVLWNKEKLLSVIKFARKIQANYLYAHITNLNRLLVQQAQKSNLEVLVWVVNTKKDLKKCILYKVKGIATDTPKLLKNIKYR